MKCAKISLQFHWLLKTIKVLH